MIYLDHHATTPVDERVFEEMKPYFMEEYGNPASDDHELGRRAKGAVDKARNQIADLINAKKKDIIFTSGATESNNLALKGVAEACEQEGNHIITTNIEHSAILDPCEKLEEQGFDVTYLPVDEDGLISPEQVLDAIRDETILISVMAANNEIGTIQPLKEVGSIAKEYDLLFHSDAAQATGYIPIDVEEMNLDMMSMSAHKMYGPKGIGALYVRSLHKGEKDKFEPPVKLRTQIHGGGHERGFRSGTLNVPSIVGFGKSAKLTNKTREERCLHLEDLQSHILNDLRGEFTDIEINGHLNNRLPHNLNFRIPGIEAKSLIVQLGSFAISTGSACNTNKSEVSHVLKAIGLNESEAFESIRLGLGIQNKKADLDQFFDCLSKATNRLNSLSV